MLANFHSHKDTDAIFKLYSVYMFSAIVYSTMDILIVLLIYSLPPLEWLWNDFPLSKSKFMVFTGVWVLAKYQDKKPTQLLEMEFPAPPSPIQRVKIATVRAVGAQVAKHSVAYFPNEKLFLHTWQKSCPLWVEYGKHHKICNHLVGSLLPAGAGTMYQIRVPKSEPGSP